MYREKNTNLWCREDTLDEYVVKEQATYTPIFENMKGKVVADIGANIGAFTYNSLKHGAKRVVAFEPDPDNIKIYKKQGFDERVKLFEGAVSNVTGQATLYQNAKGKNKGLHSLQDISGRDMTEVNTYSFSKLLKKFEPEILKIDIEGGEYMLDLYDLPEFVKGICIEIHLTHKDNRRKGKALAKSLEQQFPVVLKKPHITEKNWTTLFIGLREEE